MNLAPVATASIRLNHPLPYHLVDKRGVLIAKKGFVVESEKHLLDIAAQSGGLFIDVDNNENQAPKDVYPLRPIASAPSSSRTGWIGSTCRCNAIPFFATRRRKPLMIDSRLCAASWLTRSNVTRMACCLP